MCRMNPKCLEYLCIVKIITNINEYQDIEKLVLPCTLKEVIQNIWKDGIFFCHEETSDDFDYEKKY